MFFLSYESSLIQDPLEGMELGAGRKLSCYFFFGGSSSLSLGLWKLKLSPTEDITELKRRNCNEEFKKMLRLLFSRINLHPRCNSPGETVSTDHRELVFKYKQGAFFWRSLGHLGRERRIPLATFLLCSKTQCGSSCHCWGQWYLQALPNFSHLCLRLQVCMAE